MHSVEGVMDKLFTRIAGWCARTMGQPASFIASTLLIILWAMSGPLLNYSDTWQLMVNTATTVLTFLAVFLIQNSQNRDGAAIQAKLDEILRALDKAREEFVGIEHLTDAEICAIRDALEHDIKNTQGKDRTARPTVERLLRRY
jgi:low affinity Fe/Cu permease